MKGLIKKDIYVCLKTFRPIYLLILCVIVIPLSQNPQFIMPILCIVISMFFSMMVSTSMFNDEKSGWIKYQKILPISGFKIVLAKYLFALILMIISELVEIIIFFIMSFFIDIQKEDVLSVLLIALFISTFYSCVTVPSTYRFGADGSKYIFIAFCILPSVIPFFLKILNIEFEIKEFFMIQQIWYLCPLMIIIVISISFFASCRIIKKNK